MTNLPDHFKLDENGAPYAGDHLLVEMWGARRLSDLGFIRAALERAAAAASATVLHTHLHHFGPGQGVSGMVLLAESHISIHTWPERGYAAVDVFMCGACDPRPTVPVLVAEFAPARIEERLIRRGREARVEIQSVA